MNTYLNELNEKHNKRNGIVSDDLELNTSELQMEDTSDFEELIHVADGTNDLEYVYTYQDENVNDVIAYDKTDSAYEETYLMIGRI